jgi:lipoprotein-releasing system ATP-binding protein
MYIELKQITKRYDENLKPVFENLSLSIAEGSSVAVTGPSGSGKSTLLNLIGTLDFPSEGTVLLNGVATGSMNAEALATLRNTEIGFVFQTHLLLPQLSLLENVLLPVLPLSKNRRVAARARALQLLEKVGLGGKASRLPGALSVGECQRGAVVRALINEPGLLLADEPTGSLDHDTAELLGNLLMELQRDNAFTLMVVTHSPDLARRMKHSYSLIQGILTLQ